EGMTSRMLPNWDEDLLLTRQWDANGHARGKLAPGGWVASTDPDGKTWDLFSIGYRNPYDMAFNADGELFAYDADMEWDVGSPWYRPTRVVHATSGSEFGWRSGTGKWPTYYLDSLPPIVNIGPGSPVGVEFGYGTKFPAKYQKALYICDWTFGTMYAIHITPQGSTYVGEKEEFLSRTPLPLTDATIGHDGALYFTIGGRGTQSELYRVTYQGDESTDPADLHDAQFAEDRALRHEVEQLHRSDLSANPESARLKEKLQNADRFLRYAVTVAYEKAFLAQQPPVESIRFTGRSLPPADVMSSAVMLSRLGVTGASAELLNGLHEIDVAQLPESQQLDYLRALSLVFIRLGAPDDATRQKFIAKLDPLYPAKSHRVNLELCQMLVFLQSPTVIDKTIALLQEPSGVEEEDLGAVLSRNAGYGGSIKAMLANQPDKPRIGYAFALRNVKEGWTMDQRKAYFEFLDQAKQWSGGNSYRKFIQNIDDETFLAATELERLAIEAAGARKPFQMPELPKPAGPGKDWTLEEVRAIAAEGLKKGRDFKNGEKMFAATRCVLCHRFGGDGGATGPDLTQLAGRFNLEALTESIFDPSKIISDQYRAHVIATKDGKVHTGKIVSETTTTYTVVTDPEDSTKVVDLARADIEEMQPSPKSLMPEGLLKPLNQDEVLDLLAYLLSRGNPGDAMFRK
ncbi:MAG: c-type cytochrome, partial [Planctomycetaceae bacterium]|nr:c-type cytochrome [Planctomycetaceae bacterium]